MEFWGAVVESGEHLSVVPADCRIIHISQVAVGESKKDEGNESVCLFIKVNGKKFVIGTLFTHKKLQLSCDVVVDREFELSHNWKNGSISFIGYESHNYKEYLITESSREGTFGKQTMNIVEPEKDENTEGGDDDSGVDDLVSEDDEVETVEPVEEDKAEESNDDYSVYDADSEFDKADPPMVEGKNEDGEETTEEPLLDRIPLFSKDYYIRRLSKRLAKNDELNRMANELLDFFGEDDLCCGIPNPNTQQQPSEVVKNFWKNEDFIKGLRRQISHNPFMATDLMCYAAEFIEESPEERIARINKNYSLKYFLNAVHPRFRMRGVLSILFGYWITPHVLIELSRTTPMKGFDFVLRWKSAENFAYNMRRKKK